MGLFNKMNNVVFVKEDSDTTKFITRLELLREKLNEKDKEKINQEIKIASIGKFGEDNIAFELKNAGIPIYVIRDLHIEVNNLSAQIDFLVITRKLNLIIECKNLIGDITIDNDGNFIRNYKVYNKKVKEGIYSPITQNKRHLEVIKQYKSEDMKNIIEKAFFKKYFYDYHKTVVVLANPKTILNARYAKKEVKKQVIRADQLIQYIKRISNESNEKSTSDNEMRNRAEKFIKMHTPNKTDYAKKYELLANKSIYNVVDKQVAIKNNKTISQEKDILRKKLTKYRLDKCRNDNIKAYYIFTNKQMEEILVKLPRTIEELNKISGFGKTKIDKYGFDIIKIIVNSTTYKS